MSTLVLLPNAGRAPASPTLGPWVGVISAVPGLVVAKIATASVEGDSTTASLAGRVTTATVESDWEVRP